MKRAVLFTLIFLVNWAQAAPQRVLSLDYCADQYVLGLAQSHQIVALSPNATAPYSYFREQARGYTQVRPTAENIVALKPDLVIRAYGGGAQLPNLLARLGIPVVQLGWPTHWLGQASVAQEIERVAQALGRPKQGAALIEQMTQRLNAVLPAGAAATYLTSAGASAGPGTLIHSILNAAGVQNTETRTGWQRLDLESWVLRPPERAVLGFFDPSSVNNAQWSMGRHAVLRGVADNVPAIALDDAWISCGAWFAMDAVEAISDGWAHDRP